MQIMDDAGETNECETTIPNNASPEIVKPSKPVLLEQNDEKENTDPLESNHASESLVSSDESKEITENESKSCYDEEEIQMIDSDDETNESEEKKDAEPEPEKIEKVISMEVESKKRESEVVLEDLGSDETADAKHKTPEINEDNLYDDIENELQPHVVNLKAPVDQKNVEKPEEKEPRNVSDVVPRKDTVTSEETVTVAEETFVKKEVQEEAEIVTRETNKRRRSPSPISRSKSPTMAIQPSKKLRLELENSYGRHDKLLREYIEATSRSKSVEDVNQNISILETEIKSLDAMLSAKEDEWNNILHMKCVKEEIRMRLIRRRDTLSTKISDPSNIIDTNNTNNPLQSSTPLPNKSQSAAFNSPLLQESLKGGRHVTNSIQNLSQNVSMMPLNNNMNSATQSILQQRANMKGTDLVKEKQTAAKIQRNILPRPTTLPNHEQILRNLAMSSATSTAFHQQQLNELLNGHSKSNMGRQGPTKDVSSIIADFREKNPDVPPRRGRRVKGNSLDLFLQLLEQNSRPSSADSSHSNSNVPASNAQFKDILAQFEKMTPAERQLYSSNNSIISALNMTTQAASQGNSSRSNNNNNSNKPPPYPEVTLHPVMNSSENSSSLLHGILMKTQNRSNSNNQTSSAANVAAAAASNFTNYSPTLARLLTSPERISSHNLPNYTQASNNALAGLSASGLNLSNKNSEITITPVVNSQSLQQTLLQQKFQMEDDNDDNSTDRLVIDEGDNNQQNLLGRNAADELQESEIPECQGCRKREAQFVCAGCGNQWYCSRECQVQAWDEHSENCSG